MKTVGTFGQGKMLYAGVVCALFVTGLAGPARAEESAADKAKIKVVNDFIAAWNEPDKAVTYVSDKSSVRMVEGQPAVIGPAALDAMLKSILTSGTTVSVKTLNTTVRGPVVVNKRVDTIKSPGKPDQAFPVVGVFLVRDGKIAEWIDYLDK
jgi:limonene-1,2-epoxide hydrolase